MDVTSEQMKFFIYARKSSESDERQIQSIPDQLNALQRITEGKCIVDTLTESKSAKQPNRPVFNQLIQRIRKGEANGIIVWDASRCSRNATDTGSLIQLMDDGFLAEIVTPSQTFRNTPNDKLFFSFLCMQAKFDNDTKSVNVKRALQSKVDRGEPVQPPKVGYRSIAGKRKGERNHEPDPITFPLFKALLKKYITGRFSIMELTREAQKQGIYNYKGKIVSKTSMFRLLQDPYYCGFQKFKGKLYPLNVVPMLTFPEWELMQDIIHGKSRRLKQRHEYAFGGNLIRCGNCRYHIIGDTNTKEYKNGIQQTFTYYRCSKKGKNKCTQPYVKSDELEKQVFEVLEKIDIPEDFVELALDCINEQNTSLAEEREARRKSLEQVYNNAVRKLENLLEVYISPANSDHSMLSENDFKEVRIRVIRDRDEALRCLKEFEEQSDDAMDITAKVFNFAAGIRGRFKNGTLEDKKNILTIIGSELILLDKKLLIQIRKPLKLPKQVFEELKLQKAWFGSDIGALESSKSHLRTTLYRVRESNP